MHPKTRDIPLATHGGSERGRGGPAETFLFRNVRVTADGGGTSKGHWETVVSPPLDETESETTRDVSPAGETMADRQITLLVPVGVSATEIGQGKRSDTQVAPMEITLVRWVAL